MKKTAPGGGPVIIKKYANRRLYNTETSSYITLDHLAAMTREGRDFKVVDAKTEDDITHNVLTQIIMEEEQRGQTMLPVNFLRQLIALYGDSMQAMVPGYLEASMESFRRNQEQFKTAVEGAFANSPFAEIAKRNMAMFEAAASAFKPGSAEAMAAAAAAASNAAAAPAAPAPEATSGGDEMAALKAELARLQDKVEKLGK
ncbi:polyhydroxyalkanoate synthesis repressor PhaR [Sphingomonas sp. G-3-2-10]|uniref:polyhydroxyalkanoate synthesis repressor PhaR n=1 Tax=Sphingomonas sp. G-3-2-10 TaxID=2728838 RepID=UPI00146D2D79|nr:polyhydroxyalkanoate synthesis repressor PhaR [Sphingomonas sp. G-3-2-10]NML07506.1 polyhydroxyalkanoate synthesis repressor PhaR [Sphingomonas sp. G-3-2-10]